MLQALVDLQLDSTPWQEKCLLQDRRPSESKARGHPTQNAGSHEAEAHLAGSPEAFLSYREIFISTCVKINQTREKRHYVMTFEAVK